MSSESIHRWLSNFALEASLHEHVAGVVATLPNAVRDDLIGDPGFTLSDYDPIPGTNFFVSVGMPTRHHAGRGVVLKRTLRRRPEPFIRYVIAHELAHAHLRNAGRFPGEDPETAADALAAAWGFPRPLRW